MPFVLRYRPSFWVLLEEIVAALIFVRAALLSLLLALQLGLVSCQLGHAQFTASPLHMSQAFLVWFGRCNSAFWGHDDGGQSSLP